jgi:hypothetical protein
MIIELKSFKHYQKLSDETYCFTANIYVNGIKCGTAENRGIGGETDYSSDRRIGSDELIKQAEQFCLGLPSETLVIHDRTITLDMNLCSYIDNLVDGLVKAKYKEKDAQKLRKEMQSGILIGDDEKYAKIGFKIPLSEVMAKHPDYFQKTLKEMLVKYGKDGSRLLNTNIPIHFLPS